MSKNLVRMKIRGISKTQIIERDIYEHTRSVYSLLRLLEFTGSKVALYLRYSSGPTVTNYIMRHYDR